MAVGSDKTRILINIPIELKERVETEAKKENRSVSNYIITVLKNHIEAKDNK